MDDGETQESLTMSLSNAEDAPPSLPKMHSLVQCRTENYWEIESSGENWLRFIKASSEPPFESQASDESEQESNKSKVFATIASTEPRTQASTDSAAKEMIIQLEVCFVTDIGYLLAVKAMEDSHGKLYTMRKEDYAARSRKLLTHRKLHLMRPGDKICYIQGNDQLLMEYKCETVIETSHSQNLGRESLSYLDNTQETDVPITQRDVRKSHDGIFFTQDHDPDDPYSQTTKESVVPPKTDVSLQQANKTENVKVIDDAIMSQASSGDTTIDPDEVQEDTISPKGAQSSKRARESPTSVDTEDDNGEFGPSLTHKEPPQSAKSLILSAQLLNDQKPATRDEMKESSGSLTVQKEKKTPIGDEVEDSSDLLVSESLHNHNGTLKPAPTLEQLPELMNDCKTPGKDDFAQPPDAQPQREKAKEPSLGDGIKESSDLFVSDLVNNAASKAKEVVKHSPAVMKDRETETSGSQAVKSDKAKETPINDRSPDAMNDREIPGGEVEESPSLFAPTQPADLFSAATNGEVSHPLSPDDTQIKKQSNQSSTRKRAFVVSDRVTPLKTRSEPVRMTRSRTGSAVKHPRSGGKSGKGPQILVTGYEVDSIMEEVGPMIIIVHYPFLLLIFLEPSL
ncbi:hypothetical protein FisN_11Lh055 [Fistulifera solaris]|uniref:Uncharacterized protein n=1 Tax=Fistulifera solaris TaxID=1519565 RepID=A0A1Z5J820_FISSO|nr:hypothetical protein FisN_11Lh055 [Fistulifera solaris]|eukprot:GAX09958.1 hypothetical protein FisN_11Lh055 [Fistulifera solaris]